MGAKYAFDALSTALGIDSPTQEYTIYPVTHSFQGTLTSKSGYDKGMDTIELIHSSECKYRLCGKLCR